MPAPIIGRQVSDQVWADLRAEFTLPALEQVRRRLTELTDDPEPVMQQLIRVFLGDGTYCPGFQFLAGGQLHPTVTSLFRHALELRIPHNHFTAWMITPAPELCGVRPVDSLREMVRLRSALEAFATDLPGLPAASTESRLG